MTLYGRTIDAYSIGRLLGRGSFGDVYEAQFQHSGQSVAIKMISKELLQNQGLLDRITREVEIHCQLQHPHIVELFEYFEDDRRVYLVMELCHKGELLAQLRQRGRFDAKTARTYFSQLVDGVAYLHSHSILHRDLKLSNLLLSSDNTLKIADFGLAAAIGKDDPERRTICGTPNYMCPEIVEQQPYSLGADLWSLGVTLYTLLTGTPPFQSDAVRGTLQRVGCTDYLLPRDLPADAADLITQLLQKNPSRRLPLSAIQSHPFLVGWKKPPESRGTREASQQSGERTRGKDGSDRGLSERRGEAGGAERAQTAGNNNHRREGFASRTGDPERPSQSGLQGASSGDSSKQSHSHEMRRKHARHREGDGFTEGGHVTLIADERRARDQMTSQAERPSTTLAEGYLVERSSVDHLGSQAEPHNDCHNVSSREAIDIRRADGDRSLNGQVDSQRPSSSLCRETIAPSLRRSDHPRAGPECPLRSQLPTRPLCTLRLKALQHQTSYGSQAILEDGKVEVRHTGPPRSVFTVSSDGLEVELEQARRPKKSYRFPALPDALLMHYAHAAAFVNLVASATPKVVYIFEKGQATLMENGDLQVCFTDCSVATLLQVEAASGKTTVYPQNGSSVTLPNLHSRPTDFQSDESGHDTWLWEALSHARRCQRKCQEAEARALARNPPKTFPLVARSARLKSISQRGAADATVALASAPPPAEVERAGELLAAVQSLHTSLLPANVSIPSAAELSFASSNSSASQLERGLRSFSQQRSLQVVASHGGRSSSSPNPALHSLSQIAALHERSSHDLPNGSMRDCTPHSAGSREELKRQLDRQDSLEDFALPPARGETRDCHVASRRANEEVVPDAPRCLDRVQAFSRNQRPGKAPELKSAEACETKESKHAAGSGNGGMRATVGDVSRRVDGVSGRKEEHGRVLADVSNRQLADAQQRTKGEARMQGREDSHLDKIRRKPGLLKATDRWGETKQERRSSKTGANGFKVFEDALGRPLGEDRRRGKLPTDQSASVDPFLQHAPDGSTTERAREPRSFSNTWQDVVGRDRERLSRPMDSPSTDMWQDERSRDPLLEDSGVRLDRREKPCAPREDARSYVASSSPEPPSKTLSSPLTAPLMSTFKDAMQLHDPNRFEKPQTVLAASKGALADPRKVESGGSGALSTMPQGGEKKHQSRLRGAALQSKPSDGPPPLSLWTHSEPSDGRPSTGQDAARGRQSAYFPGVGWAIRLKSGELLMHYVDECQMVVSNDGATVEYWPPGAKLGGSKHNLSDRRSIPNEVRDKLQYLSSFIKLIREQSQGGKQYPDWMTPRTAPSLAASHR